MKEFIVALDLELESAPDLAAAGEAFAAWLAPWDSVRILNPLTWVGGDTLISGIRVDMSCPGPPRQPKSA